MDGLSFGHYISKYLGLGLHWKDPCSIISFLKLSKSDFVLFQFCILEVEVGV
jgi:hypothetical protein